MNLFGIHNETFIKFKDQLMRCRIFVYLASILTTLGLEVLEVHDLGHYESLLKVWMNSSGCLRSGCSFLENTTAIINIKDLPFILAYKSRNFGRNFGKILSTRLIRGAKKREYRFFRIFEHLMLDILLFQQKKNTYLNYPTQNFTTSWDTNRVYIP